MEDLEWGYHAKPVYSPNAGRKDNRMLMPNFAFVRPKSLQEAIKHLSSPHSRIHASSWDDRRRVIQNRRVIKILTEDVWAFSYGYLSGHKLEKRICCLREGIKWHG